MAANNLDRFAPLLATYLVHSTLWIGGCGALLWLTRVRNPAIRHTAWKCTVVAGFVTAIMQFTLPLTSNRFEWTLTTSSHPALPVAQQHRGTNADLVVVQPSFGVEDVHDGQGRSSEGSRATKSPVANSAPLHQHESAAAGSVPLQQISHPDASALSGFVWLRGVVMIWLAGVMLLLIRLLLTWRRLGNLGDVSELTVGKERELLDRLLAATRIRRPVRLFRSRSGINPMAWGFWHWRIAVPCALLEQLDRRELRALLAHELGHLARGDTRWLWAWSVLGAAGFFQPLNRIAHKQIRRAAELLSDSWAANATGDRLSLARALTKTAELHCRLAMPLASPAVGLPSALAERVDRLIETDPRTAVDSSKGHWLTVVLASLAITAAVVWLPYVRLTTAGELSERGPLPSDDAALVSSYDAIRALDREFVALDAEIGQLEPLVARARGNQTVDDAWRAIERRRAKMRDGHIHVMQLVEQVTAGASPRPGNP